MTNDTLALLLVRRAMRGVEELPIEQRADVFEAAAEALAVRHPEESRLASQTANQLREASALQMTFASLITEKPTA